ncbi:nicotinate-nucleotide--dimethylbenzimidazole phosphoribosyltransferase [Pelotomaculum terephthalicicum JT]|uniref:nicotinate-nucleotide--dimethylbenzimidazole phosphoribosyltransferase n=1 Tax=Pelotomaculum TaxID=191373 RepID=UPI0009D49A0D|nr:MULTISPECIES: nicotinate-nucleotide--dimethylbenzimidazole phosphoribosyltransferase [Pelotomaculum]MCG9967319.1 nicotinate-nucleotide--dimethylbenzimidazole phosphoribosyltransferase [Pelotomaculum terephthalicicum JT]OPX89401.1 MAG: Nicotinate-nucleotide--dimethylbenzimidazole phosphoribosyltransferase [Pelotomaculum sp. PtaB.Bin117]OPY61786.1 MAG: Nicotinate-nucleotide--dimethylbenzimidazole phosphoribosyltransferase [Pelotomaculum sp. PtaU1.Bin065]
MELLTRTMEAIKPLNNEAKDRVQARLDNLTKPPGSLGVLEDIVLALAGITGRQPPAPLRKTHVLMAGDHGVTACGVSAFPREVTLQMVLNFANGGAAINVLARHAGVELLLVDIGVAADLPDLPGLLKRKVSYGTANLAEGPALTREQAIAALEVGIEVANDCVRRGAELLGTGEMGIGNTTPSTAILAALSGKPVRDIVGRGTGLDDQRLELKIKAIEQGLKVNRPDPEDGLDVLAKLGGLEIAGLAGLILAGAAARVPVMIDGFISAAAACIAAKLNPLCRRYMIASHLSEEPGHRVMLQMLGLRPMLTMRMRLGEGTGAVLGMTLVDAAVKVLNEMATFSEAGVAESLPSAAPTA